MWAQRPVRDGGTEGGRREGGGGRAHREAQEGPGGKAVREGGAGGRQTRKETVREVGRHREGGYNDSTTQRQVCSDKEWGASLLGATHRNTPTLQWPMTHASWLHKASTTTPTTTRALTLRHVLTGWWAVAGAPLQLTLRPNQQRVHICHALCGRLTTSCRTSHTYTYTYNQGVGEGGGKVCVLSYM